MSACRTCGAEIVWAPTRNKKTPMPLDAEPNSRGNVVIENGLAIVLGPLEELLLAGKIRYMPHHATCPQGKDWRRRP
jgi:hypothetical protein